VLCNNFNHIHAYYFLKHFLIIFLIGDRVVCVSSDHCIFISNIQKKFIKALWGLGHDPDWHNSKWANNS